MSSLSGKRILILPAAGIGDFIMATPVITSLRKRFPDAYIAVLAHHSRGTAELGRFVPYLDEVIDLPLRHYSWLSVIRFFLSSFWPMLLKLIKKRFDTFVILAKNPIRTVIRVVVKPDLVLEVNGRGHPTKDGLELVSKLGCPAEAEYFEVNVPDIDINRFLPAGISRPAIGVHPFSGMFWRGWVNYEKLIERLSCFGGTVVLLGEDDRHNGLTMPGVIDLVNKLSIAELIAVTNSLDILVSCDSGPMHIGFAVETPTVGVFNTVRPEFRMPLISKVCHVAVWDNSFKAEEIIVKERTTKRRSPTIVNVEQVVAAVQECMKKNRIIFS